MEEGKNNGMQAYFSGEKLYGDDFSPEQISRWYEEESEGYANLGNKDLSSYVYPYHALNRIHGFRHLKGIERFDQVLGFGSAWGHEFEPLIGRISHLTIIDPSENMVSEQIGPIRPSYVKPRVDGTLAFPDNSFDLATCFGTLHHIPNVSYVLGEILRVLKTGGTLLLREPIISFGNWNHPRPGLTKNERGIPVSHFEKIFNEHPVTVIHRSHCFTMTYQLQLLLKGVLKKPLHSYGAYVHFDRFLSSLLKSNVRYHAVQRIHKIAPSAIFYVIRKN
jgi:SAM-dependent methyltransferase